MSPAYVAPPYAKRSYLVPGIIGFSFGSFNEQEPPTKMQVTSVAMTGGTATLGVTILEGDAPLVGSLISVRGTQTGAGEWPLRRVLHAAGHHTRGRGGWARDRGEGDEQQHERRTERRAHTYPRAPTSTEA